MCCLPRFFSAVACFKAQPKSRWLDWKSCRSHHTYMFWSVHLSFSCFPVWILNIFWRRQWCAPSRTHSILLSGLFTEWNVWAFDDGCCFLPPTHVGCWLQKIEWMRFFRSIWLTNAAPPVVRQKKGEEKLFSLVVKRLNLLRTATVFTGGGLKETGRQVLASWRIVCFRSFAGDKSVWVWVEQDEWFTQYDFLRVADWTCVENITIIEEISVYCAG